jgi:hypothetical protein
VGHENIGDHGAHDWQRGLMGAGALAFALEPDLSQGREDDVPLPPRERAPFEVIEAQFVFEFLILLLYGPPLIREPHQSAQRSGRGQVDQIVLGAVAPSGCAFA